MAYGGATQEASKEGWIATTGFHFIFIERVSVILTDTRFY